jgi:hypothetical protein
MHTKSNWFATNMDGELNARHQGKTPPLPPGIAHQFQSNHANVTDDDANKSHGG